MLLLRFMPKKPLTMEQMPRPIVTVWMSICSSASRLRLSACW